MSSRRGAPGGRQPVGDVLQVVHLEAEVMDARPVLSALDASDLVVLELVVRATHRREHLDEIEAVLR